MANRFYDSRYGQLSEYTPEHEPSKKRMDKDFALNLIKSKIIKETVNSSHSELLHNSILRRLIEEIEANYV